MTLKRLLRKWNVASQYVSRFKALRQAIKKFEKGIDLSCQSGEKTSLSSEVEKKLANVIGVLCKIGFSPSKDEVLDLVSKYL